MILEALIAVSYLKYMYFTLKPRQKTGPDRLQTSWDQNQLGPVL